MPFVSQLRPPVKRRRQRPGLPSPGQRLFLTRVRERVEQTMNGHAPVLLEETLEVLGQHRAALEPARFLDCTFGGGGHSRAILQRFPGCELYGIDTDPEAAPRAEALAAEFPGRVHFRDANFEAIPDLPLGGSFSGILFDFGVSSFHFDTAGRGFSFRMDAPLDMRLNPRAGQSAAEFLETADAEELVVAVRNYGEEPRWRRLVQAIIDARGTGRLQRTLGFAELVEQAVGKDPRSRIHPATRAFQGIRIAVNDELGVIERALPAAFERLAPGGVLAVISFHSLEDRIAKRFFRRMAGQPESRRDFAPQQSRVRQADLLNRRPVEASETELAANPRARSAKLRALIKVA